MKKSSSAKIVSTYANALYEAAVESNDVARVCGDIVKLQQVLRDDKELVKYLASPLWEEKDKTDVVRRLADILELDDKTLNCLDVIVENRRVVNLVEILDCFVKVYYQKNGVAEVDVETVKPLTSVQDKRLQKVLVELLGRDVVVNYMINPAILGGLRIKNGSKMYDDSLVSKLNYLENVMKGK